MASIDGQSLPAGFTGRSRGGMDEKADRELILMANLC